MKNLERPKYYLQMTWFQYFENPKEYIEKELSWTLDNNHLGNNKKTHL